MAQGYITIAYGSRFYLEAAVDLALSLQATCDAPMSLVVSSSLLSRAKAEYHDVFEHIVPLPKPYRVGRAAKFCLAEVTPYEETMFIDADSLILTDLSDLWKQAKEAEVTMIGRYVSRDSQEYQHGIPVRELIQEFGLSRFFRNHSAAFIFRPQTARQFFERCFHIYKTKLHTLRRRLTQFVGDELAFGVAAESLPVASFSEPAPVYWPHELSALTPPTINKGICHFIGSPPPDTLGWLLEGITQRRRRAGLQSPKPQWCALEAELRGKSSWPRRLVLRARKTFYL